MGNTYKPSEHQEDPQTEEELEQAIAEEEAASQEETGEETPQDGTEETSEQQVSSESEQAEEEPAPEPEPEPEQEDPVKETSEQETVTQEPTPSADDEQQGPESEEAESNELVNDSDMNAALKLVKGRLDDYVQYMAPNQMRNETEIATQQGSLFRAFRSVLQQPGQDFTTGMNMIVAYFKAYRQGAFAPNLVGRGFDVVSLPNRDRLAFERLIRLFSLTAQTGSVSQVTKHIDLNKVLEVLPGNTHEKLLEFYSAE